MEQGKIPDTTIDALSRNLFKESLQYGFKYEDYIRFVNTLLEYAIESKNGHTVEVKNNSNGFIKSVDKWTLPLETEHLIIREFQAEDDKKLLEEWMKDKFGRYFLLSITSTITHTIETVISSEKNILGIVTLKDGKPIGTVAFLNNDPYNQKAELRKLIGDPNYRRKGYGKEATRYWIKYGFKNLDLKKIYLNTTDTNFHNIKINEELGFKVEGILRDEILFDGIPHDVLRMGLLNKDI